MGCEADITLRRVERGEYVISTQPKKYPSFVVTEPVVVTYGQFERIGGDEDWNGWTNLTMYDEPIYSYGEIVIVGSSLALRVCKLQEIQHIVEQWRTRGLGPGSESMKYLEESWAKITPGRWLVENYFVSGMGDDGGYFYLPKLPDDVELGVRVKWEIWT